MAHDDYDRWAYVSAAARRLKNERARRALETQGARLSPIVIASRAIAVTFWGKAWCDNLERYSDFANRLPRGRSYVRSGAVLDLQIASGIVTAKVSGSDLYRVDVTVGAVPAARWASTCRDCAGEIDTVVALLQGRISDRMMSRLCDRATGLFPSPREIAFTCSCPDRAAMCKHVAAVLYGIGARLDHEPALLFILRQVDLQDLVARVGTSLERGARKPLASRVLDTDLSAMFGIEITDRPEPTPPGRLRAVRRRRDLPER